MIKTFKKILDWIYLFIIFKTARDVYIRMYGFEAYKKSLKEWLRDLKQEEKLQREFKNIIQRKSEE